MDHIVGNSVAKQAYIQVFNDLRLLAKSRLCYTFKTEDEKPFHIQWSNEDELIVDITLYK